MKGMEVFPGVIERVEPFMKQVLSGEQLEWLRKWFPVVENSRLMKVTGLTHSSLHRFARQYGLTKSEAGIRRIKRRQAAQIKKVCERNGYYDSLRGKRPSDKCIEASKRMWKSPDHEHPFLVMKKRHPRKYKAMCEKAKERRVNQIKTDRLREFYGMPRKTKLHIPQVPYTSRQIMHRYSALKRGYMVNKDRTDMEDRYKIFYDEHTDRSELFEENCRKDGFVIEEYTDYETD